ncbi:glycosyltransferase [bacterium]|nr:glycosyltransferase [bacterium]
MQWKPLESTHYQQLRQNLDELKQHMPMFYQAIPDFERYAKTLYIQEENGFFYGVCAKQVDGDCILFPLRQHETLLQDQRRTIQNAVLQGGSCLMISGIGVGHAVQMAFELLSTSPRAVVIAWEENPYAWAAFLALFDLRAMIKSRRVFLFGGPTWEADLLEFIEQHYLYLLKNTEIKYVLGALPTDTHPVEPYVQQAKSIARQYQELVPAFDHATTQFLSQMQKPVGSRPQSIWCCGNPHSYIHYPIAQAFLRGFEQAGLDTSLASFERPIPHQCKVIGSLISTRPDLLLSINTWPGPLLEDIGLSKNAANSVKHPRLCWIVDNTTLYESEKETFPIQKMDWYFCIDRTYLTWLTPQTEQAHFLPAATMLDGRGTYREEFAAPISYVGSLPDIDPYLQKCSASLREMLQKVESVSPFEPCMAFTDKLELFQPKKDEREQLQQAAEAFCQTTQKGFTQPQAMLEYFLYTVVTYFKRKRIVTALLPLGLKVFGPDSWRRELPGAYQDRFGGFVSHNDLPDVYRSADLSLNIHSHQCPTCLNPRDFDVPMAGGLVLGDYVEDVERGFFKPGEEILFFTSEEEMIELAQTHLADRDRLNGMKEKAHERVRQEHTYFHRAETILGLLADRYEW